MQQSAILFPALTMVALTVVVWLRLYVERLTEIRARRIDPQALATSRKRTEVLQNTSAADNFRNLFELPVLFYVLCLALLVAQAVSPLFVYGAWLYVILRALHSVIHCTYNRVIHRFAVYTASSIVLFVLWGAFGAVLLAQ
jgi:hypothetical protein